MALWIALTSESTQSVGGLEPQIDPLFGDCFWELLWTFSLFRAAALSSSLLGPGTSDDADAPLELVCSSPSNVLLRFFTGSTSPPVFLSSDSSLFCCCSVSLAARVAFAFSCFLFWYLRQTDRSASRLGCSSGLMSDFCGARTENSRDIARSSCEILLLLGTFL